MNVFAKNSSRGHEIVMDKTDAVDLIANLTPDTKVEFVAKNPKRPSSKAAERFAQYSKAKTVTEYIDAGGNAGDALYDIMRGFMIVK